LSSSNACFSVENQVSFGTRSSFACTVGQVSAAGIKASLEAQTGV
jgi:hypothetical protein